MKHSHSLILALGLLDRLQDSVHNPLFPPVIVEVNRSRHVESGNIRIMPVGLPPHKVDWHDVIVEAVYELDVWLLWLSPSELLLSHSLSLSDISGFVR